MNEDQIRPECEHRFSVMETLWTNHIPHLERDIQIVKKMLWSIAGAIFSGFIGLIFFLLKGHIVFK